MPARPLRGSRRAAAEAPAARALPVAARRSPGGGGGRAPLTPEQQAAQQARAAELKKWRFSVSMDKYKAMRKMYNDAGVDIYAFKLEPNPNMSDEEYEYIFHVADTLGANHVTLELSNNAAFTKRVGDFAAKKKMRVAYHAHTQATITAWDAVLEQSTGNAINLDCGHYVAGTSESPIPLIRKHSSRIASMHLKDRKKPIQRRAESGVGAGRDADQGNPDADAAGEIQIPGEYRIGIPDSRGFRRRGRSRPNACSSARTRWRNFRAKPILQRPS